MNMGIFVSALANLAEEEGEAWGVLDKLLWQVRDGPFGILGQNEFSSPTSDE